MGFLSDLFRKTQPPAVQEGGATKAERPPRNPASVGGRDAKVDEQAKQDGLDAIRKKDYVRAARAFRRALTLDAGDTDTWSNLGAAYYLFVQDNLIPYVGGNWGINILVFDETGSVSPGLRRTVASLIDPRHLQGLKRCLYAARRCFDQSLALDDRPTTARYWRALLYRNTGHFAESREELRKVAQSGLSEDDQRNAGGDLDVLQRLTWDKVNATSVPPGGAAAVGIEELFGDKLRELLREFDGIEAMLLEL